MTVTGKAILLGAAMFLALFKKKEATPTQTAPEETPAAEPPPAPEDACADAAPVLGKRWTICDGNIATTSEGDYDALYNDATKKLIAVLDNTTYDDGGNSAFVVGVLDPAGYIRVLSSRDDVPFFPIEFGSDIYG